LLRYITQWLHFEKPYEFSVEANPNRLTQEKIALLAEYGVTRISIGAQTFQPRLLRTLERDHEPGDVARAVELSRSAIDQVSLDLIFGAPGESLDEWQDDLAQAIALDPHHISTYGLTYERGTRLWKQRQLGELRGLSEDYELAMYVHALDALAEAGFESYEVSNHARPGNRCRHNEVYWANHAYYGFGLGAARYIDGRRATNTRNLQDYLRRALAGEPTIVHAETLSPEARARETIALQLRRLEGVERGSFAEQTGFALDALAGDAIRRYVASGHLSDDTYSVRLTRKGKFVADTLIRDFI
jgi:oxygen-independent coproporphyrinogen-3 oxidase